MFRTILDISDSPDMTLCAWIADKQFVLNCNRQSPFDDIVSAFEVLACLSDHHTEPFGHPSELLAVYAQFRHRGIAVLRVAGRFGAGE